MVLSWPQSFLLISYLFSLPVEVGVVCSHCRSVKQEHIVFVDKLSLMDLTAELTLNNMFSRNRQTGPCMFAKWLITVSTGGMRDHTCICSHADLTTHTQSASQTHTNTHVSRRCCCLGVSTLHLLSSQEVNLRKGRGVEAPTSTSNDVQFQKEEM